MTVTIRIEVPGCSVIPVVNGQPFTAWTFNDNDASTLAAWHETCRLVMTRAAADAGVQAELSPGWEAIANEFFATSQSSEWREEAVDDNYASILNHAHAIGILRGILILQECNRPITDNVIKAIQDCIAQYDKIQEYKKCPQ